MKQMCALSVVVVLFGSAFAASAAAESAIEKALEEIQEQLERVQDTVAELVEKAEEKMASEEVLEEVEEHVDRIKEWVTDRVAELGLEQPEPAPLGKTVTLVFFIEGVSEPLSLSVARPRYSLNVERIEYSTATGDAKAEERLEYGVNVEGTLSLDGEDGALLTCEGWFRVEETAESGPSQDRQVETNATNVTFDASVGLKPGEKRVLADDGKRRLTVTLLADPVDGAKDQ